MALYEQIEHAGTTDVGIRRSYNQDAFRIQKAIDRDHFTRVGHIYLVADGMGGHAVGEKASAKASQEIPLIYAKHVQEGPIVALRRAFQETNAGIHAIGQENPEFRGLGTTATALVLRDEGAWVAHVGDSRVMRVRDGQIEQISFDHSYVWEMARRLNVPPEELADVKKNVIIRSLGPDPLVQVDIEGPYPLQTGDIFVLCSDGLSNVVEPDEIGSIVSVLPPQEASKLLIELANLRGGPDNITALIIRVGNSDASVMASSSKTKRIGAVNRMLTNWFSRVPWPLAALGVGFLSAAMFVYARINEWPSMPWFILSALSILAGLVGLVLKARKTDDDSGEPETTRKLNIYRDYDCHISKELIEKFSKLSNEVKLHLESQKVTAEWKGYLAQRKVAAQHLAEGDLVAAFQEEIRALGAIAKVYNQTRQKEEGFKPKFGQGAEW